MTPRTKKTTAALGGALVLASGAYALGSQAGDGAALAGSATTDPARVSGPGPGRHLSGAADRLGVTEAKLRAALQELRADRRDDHEERHAALAKLLADELGISAAKVETALEARHGARKLRRDDRRGDRRDAFAADLARELGVAPAKVRSALEALRPDGRRGGPPDLGALAQRIGVSEAKLRAALEEVRPGRRGPRGHGAGPGARAADVTALAKDLGVTEAKLRAAFEKVRAAVEREHEARRAAFVKALAAELGVSEAKVEEVIDRGPHHGRRGP